jgi:hypothetical protein
VKIILSRKGFDSSTGKVPSPIFPSGEIWSLPIPTRDEPFHSYEQITRDGQSLGLIVHSLTEGKIAPHHHAHLDPDLSYESVPRSAGWRPIFGQAGAAETHLQRNGVSDGDIFIFYGWFRQIECVGTKYRYVNGAPDLHVIFGWLQVEQRFSVHDRASIPPWALEHQHCLRYPERNDSIYISSEKLCLPGIQLDKAGAGTFRRFHQALCLTCPGETRSVWRLPGWFSLRNGKFPLTYHRSEKRWTTNGEFAQLRSVGRGQEFVLDCEAYPEAIEWLANIFTLAD